MNENIFKRYELKFMIDKTIFAKMKNEITKYMNLDEYCKKSESYMIYNIYFDTENDDIIRKSIEKPYYKEKLRLRCYKIPVTQNDKVFLELKKKINSIVNKRRVTMTLQEAESYLKSSQMPDKMSYMDNQVLNEIPDFLERYQAKQKVFLSYERVAFYGKDNHDFRITFDRNILTRREKANFTAGDFGAELLDDDKYLMEVKICGAIPLWLAHLMSDIKIYKTSFSKYGEEYKKNARTNKQNNIQDEKEAFLRKCFLTA